MCYIIGECCKKIIKRFYLIIIVANIVHAIIAIPALRNDKFDDTLSIDTYDMLFSCGSVIIAGILSFSFCGVTQNQTIRTTKIKNIIIISSILIILSFSFYSLVPYSTCISSQQCIDKYNKMSIWKYFEFTIYYNIIMYMLLLFGMCCKCHNNTVIHQYDIV